MLGESHQFLPTSSPYPHDMCLPTCSAVPAAPGSQARQRQTGPMVYLHAKLFQDTPPLLSLTEEKGSPRVQIIFGEKNNKKY